MPDYRIRQATVSDASVIARHRVGIFRDLGAPPDEAAKLEPASRARLIDQLGSGEYVGWLVESSGEVVAGAGVLLHSYLPSPVNPRGRPTAYILNIYTEPGYRRPGFAFELLTDILAWCREHDIPRASLYPPQSDRSLYERLGFAPTSEMRVETGASVNGRDT